MTAIKPQITELLELLAIIILESPEGFSEHQLLSQLQRPPYNFFAKDALQDPLLLFQTHFLLFHCLYQLRRQWHLDGRGWLEISALSIVIQPLTAAPQESILGARKQPKYDMLSADPLAQYYLDWSHFSATNSADVEALLASFWQQVNHPIASESLQQALIYMELEAPVAKRDLKVQYRRLAQRYHPDKGGDSEHFKNICRAYHQLKHYSVETHSI